MKQLVDLSGRRRQRGSVAILFGVTIFLLFGFMALVIDLGRTYVVRTELQNAADAAALAGAKDLNHTRAGVESAVAHAIAIAAQNSYKFSLPVSITGADMWVADRPDLQDNAWTPVASVTTDAAASGKTFLKVKIPSGELATFFAVIPPTGTGTGTASTSTYGVAVAGRLESSLTPIGICAIKNAAGVSRPRDETLMPGVTNELAQFGFRHGVSYNVFALGPLGAPSNPYLLDPIDVYPNHCEPSNASADATAPFICNGTSAMLSRTPGTVYGNTGVSAGKIEAALNSRFNIYSGPSVCTPAQAPPDTNIRKFGCTGASCVAPAADWMAPSDQTVTPAGIPTLAQPVPTGITSKNQYGVLWSYSRAVKADGTELGLADWASLYQAPGGAPTANANFPAVGSPYLDSGHTTAPVGNTGQADRRVVNLVIVDCPAAPPTGGSCTVLPVVGVGRFFMQVPADFSGSPKKLQVEFAGLIEPVPIAEIKLYGCPTCK
jgi:Flp pilus assembly protein TadG